VLELAKSDGRGDLPPVEPKKRAGGELHEVSLFDSLARLLRATRKKK